MQTDPVFTHMTENEAIGINVLRDIVTDWAEKKGWHENQQEMTPRHLLMYKGEKLLLVDSEIAECHDALRAKDQPAMDDKVTELTGEAAELADALIRILHYAGEFNIDLGRAVMLKHNFNISRPYRHGKNC